MPEFKPEELRLYLVEGIGPNRASLVKELKSRGVRAVRGIPHQNGFNSDLIPAARQVVNGVNLNFEYCLSLPSSELEDVFKKCIKVYTLAFKEAADIARDQSYNERYGITILDRGIPSLTTLSNLFYHRLRQNNRDEEAELLLKTREATLRNGQMAGFGGTILVNEEYNIFSPEKDEQILIREELKSIRKQQGVKLLEIDHDDLYAPETGLPSSTGIERFFGFARIRIPSLVESSPIFVS